METRQVKFKRWITAVHDDKGKLKEGTRCWDSDFIHYGWFHQWAAAYEESSEGFGNYTVALIELENGTIEQVLPSNVKFLD